ncbi:hypothetical protein Cob_v010313 [Colletotrichum orbiculare MAFF 240422]|uniref:Uncharacterized protein n=1 Tax=Colletotrichum orbiculare (strain 104-T / ATCC 96160 / CBS 514.97 / LARS 414 / MAFF 240422) TaxID=1213857 RepID=A0A484FFP2_COLOR|nr:hypothetical protein Cob_v010313 [Colletotrichum orbiculare MAFF 240422]
MPPRKKYGFIWTCCMCDRPLRVLPSSTKAIFIIADYQTGTMNYQGFPAVGILKPDTPVNRHSPTNITNPPSSLQDDAKNAQLLKALHHSTPTGAFAWPTRFLLQAPVSRSWENQPWRCIRLPAEGVSDYESYLLNTDPIWQADQSGVNAILDILGDATLQKLTDGDISGLQPKVAVLIDGKDSNGIPQLREPQPGLTAKGLFDELCKKRYNADEPDSSGDPRFVEAERRLIYITNLDSWSILALIGTAPESLTHVLSKFIPNYIRAASSLGVSFSTEGPETFTMQFSFPFRIKIHSEWRHVIQNLAERLNSRTTRHSKFLKRMRDCSRRSTAGPSQEEAILEFDSFEDDITGYKQLIEELVPNLQETVDSGECFMKTDVNYFPYQYDSLGEEPTCLPYLTQVRNVFNDLSLMHKRLEALRTKCDRATEDSSRSREGLIQNRQSPHQGLNETLLSTRAIIISQPIVLAAAIFECGIISRPTGITFVITLVVIVSLLPLLVAATVWLPKIKWKSAWSYVSAVCRGPRETDPATNSTGEPPTPRLQRRQTTMTRFMDWFQFGWVGWLLGGRQYPDDHVDGFQDAQGSLTRPPTAVLAGGHQEIELVRQERR